ncbi:MAG: SDR family NAD(P)-dependent oxidoreductase, partial [Pseudonocardiaceae bacterium]
TSAAELHIRGIPVNWASIWDGIDVHQIDLPTYPFQRQRYWLEELEVPDPLVVDEVDRRFWSAAERKDLDELAETLGLEGPRERSGLGMILPALSAWRHQRREQSTVDSWRYHVSWKLIADGAAPVLSGTWLLVVPAEHVEDKTAAAVLDGLTASGARVRQVSVHGHETDRLALVERVREVLAEAGSVDGVVSLLSLDESRHPDTPMLTTGMVGLLALVQALGDSEVRAPLWGVTQGAVQAPGDDRVISVEQASAWGLGRVVALEHPGRWGGLVDLPDIVDEQAVRRLITAWGRTDGEDQLAVRASGTFVRRLVRAPRGGDVGVRPWTPRGTVLVTGGTGGVAAHVARWLAANGAEHLVLTSRRGLEAEGAAALADELAELGTEVTVTACDMADRSAVAELLAAIPTQRPLTAVVHAAGVATPAALNDTGVAEFAEVMAGKAAGAAHLDELLADQPLDAFVLFSSNAAIWGSGTQGAYAAANAFLDGLAQRRSARGLTATSIAWGAWDGGGMSTFSPQIQAQLAQSGLTLMPPDLAISALAQAVGQDETCVVVTDMRWDTFALRFTALRPSPLFHELPEVRQALSDSDDDQATDAEPSIPEFVQRLHGLSPTERSRRVVELVRTEVSSVLGHATTNAVAAEQAFSAIGFDSLTAVQLRNRLVAATGLRLSRTVVFDHPTPRVLADHLAAELDLLQADAAPAVLTDLDTVEAALSAAADDETLRSRISLRLREVVAKWESLTNTSGVDEELDLSEASDDEIFRLVDSQLGTLEH